MFQQDSNDPEPAETGYTCCFAIVPDDDGAEASPADVRPVAMFETIEDAMDWGLHHYKGGAFRVRYQKFVATAVGRSPSTVQ